MIVKMKEVTLLCLERDRSGALEALRDLGVMHVKLLGRVDSPDVAELTAKVANTVKVYNILSGRSVSGTPGKTVEPEQLVSDALRYLDQEAAVEKQRENLLKEIEKLEPWGDFEPEQLRKLRASGLHVGLCTAFKSDFPKMTFPEGASVTEISCSPPCRTATVILSAPASREFSSSSFRTEAGRSTTSPAAILL